MRGHLFECECGNSHRYREGVIPPKAPPGWLIGPNGKPICDDCANAKRARQQRVTPASNRSAASHDPVLLQVIALFLGKGEYSACSHAQRKLGIGYNEAARHIEVLERAGVISAANNVGKRKLQVSDMRQAKALLDTKLGIAA